MCPSTPHAEAVFRNPRWAFDTPIHVPLVSLGSESIVRRHVHSLLLARFFEVTRLAALELECKPFFALRIDSSAYVDEFCTWLTRSAATDADLLSGLRMVTARTALEIEPTAAESRRCWSEPAVRWAESEKPGARARGASTRYSHFRGRSRQ